MRPLSQFSDIETPAVLADMDVVDRNIKRAAALCADAGIALRPHVKTHKIPALAERQIRAGASGVTCQTLREAEVFAEAGVDDILISYNIVGAKKIKRLRALSRRLRNLYAVADNEFVIRGLSESFRSSSLRVLAECDTGAGRCGVQTPRAAAELAQKIAAAPGLVFAGLMTYPPPRRIAAVESWLAAARDLCLRAGLVCDVISTGGTPDLPNVSEVRVASEYRAGTYIYNDRMTIAHGACAPEDCALTVLSTIVSVPADGRAVMDAGSKVLSSDIAGLPEYGEAMCSPDIRVAALSEEHGHLTCGGNVLRPGDRIRIIPNHACVVANLAEEVVAVRGGIAVERLHVSARGR